MKKSILIIVLMLVVMGANAQQRPVIYQMLVRLFGNKNTANTYYGSLEQNGVGKFNDITDIALDSLKTLGLTHIWYTGIIAHATMGDYSSFGIKPDDPDVVKGRAGSPYAIRDYYDVDPDLATAIPNRMQEFQNLVDRTHLHGLKVIIDFVPNHVARTYHSYRNTNGVTDFGAYDDTTKSFSNQNDFYYLPNTSFVVPKGVDAGGPHFHSPLKDGKYEEHPAKATGNNVFKSDPGIDDWYETTKLNYGLDIQNGEKENFTPIPSVWNKMLDILLYWADKGVDGFRCDMAEMVPVAFWGWAITKVKQQYPNILFIAEAYNPKVYKTYTTQAKFDYLYDKVGMYDAVKKLIRDEPSANVQSIDSIEQSFNARRLIRFLENHDEERIASKAFADNPRLAIPGMVVMATLSRNPLMVYFGQEVGEKGEGKEGFGGDDGRTSLFDYWGVPAHQAWMDDGKFDGGALTEKQKELREFYSRLLNVVNDNDAIQTGYYLPLNNKYANTKQKIYARITYRHLVVVVVNFDRTDSIEQYIHFPKTWMKKYKLHRRLKTNDILNNKTIGTIDVTKPLHIQAAPSGAMILDMRN
ncbi:MAG: alpha-amylase family protein [Chitinophagaceae bacterium]